MSASFDVAAFVAAVQAATQQPPKPVTLPGIGPCFKREITVADVEALGAIRTEMEKSGRDVTKNINIALGLAQSLCGPDGTPIFDVRNEAHVAMLAALPWEGVRGITQDDADEADATKNG